MDDWLDSDLVGKVLGGRYQLRRKLGQGGMGVVYEAWQADLGRAVAIKLLLHPGEEELARFQREARAAAGLSHPHIAQVHDFQAPAGELPFLVMELLPGCSLLALLRREGAMSAERVARLGTHVLSALAAAHSAGIVHRDVKPANVFVHETSTLGEVAKVLDFGIAKVLGAGAPNLTQAGDVVGTMAYMSPEQARGEVVDGRSDIYSASAVLYHAVSGRRPIRADNTVKLFSAIVCGDVTPLQQLRPELDPRFCAVVERGMAVERSARFQTADEMALALKAWGERKAIDGTMPRASVPSPPLSATAGPSPQPLTHAAAAASAPSPATLATATGSALAAQWAPASAAAAPEPGASWSPWPQSGGPSHPGLGATPLAPPNGPFPGRPRLGWGVAVAIGSGLALITVVGAAAWWLVERAPLEGGSRRATKSAGGVGTTSPLASRAAPPVEVRSGPLSGSRTAPGRAATTPVSPSIPVPSAVASSAVDGRGPPGTPCTREAQCGPHSFCGGNKCECDSGYHEVCSGVCADTVWDPLNCGRCGNVCPGHGFCKAGQCSPCTGPRYALCGTTCADVTYDNMNCGRCGNVCGAHKACLSGVCK